MKDPQKVLIAHADINFSTTIKDFIERDSVKVIRPTTSESTALRIIIREKPTYVILDNSFTNPTAFDIISEIRKKKFDTRFCILYHNPTNDDCIMAKSLNITGNIKFHQPIELIGEAIREFLDDQINFDAFKDMEVEDLHKERLQNLAPGYLKLLTLLVVYGESKPVIAKLNIDKNELAKQVVEISRILSFNTVGQLLRWCKANQELVFNLTIKTA